MHFNQLLKERYSVRDYKTQKVPQALLFEVLDAGRMAPSAANKQPWSFIVISDEEVLGELSKAYDRDWFKKAPQVIVICGDHEASWKRSFDQKDHCDIDAAIAIDHMTLRATELGLGTCWICHFKPDLLKGLLNLPDHLEPIALLPIGYPAINQSSTKKRKDLSEVAFENSYGNPFKK